MGRVTVKNAPDRAGAKENAGADEKAYRLFLGPSSKKTDMTDSQITIRQLGPNRYTMEFPFSEDFIAYIKLRIPVSARSYDPDTHIWTFTDDGKRLNAIEGVAVQTFRFAVRWYRNSEGKLTMKNLKTGVEMVQEELFR